MGDQGGSANPYAYPITPQGWTGWQQFPDPAALTDLGNRWIAAGAGLSCRPVAETIRDTLAWDAARGGPEKQGLDPAEEERLLAELA